MKSPRSPETILEPLVYNGIELDRCPVTGGVWFDAQELYELTQGMSAEDDFAEHFDGDWEHYGSEAAAGGCPRGHGMLEPYVVKKVEDSGTITLDICRKCMGLWVDGAELMMLRDVTLHNRAHGGPATIEPIPQNQLARLLSLLNPMTWINKFL